jgi:hypothetical protein
MQKVANLPVGRQEDQGCRNRSAYAALPAHGNCYHSSTFHFDCQALIMPNIAGAGIAPLMISICT